MIPISKKYIFKAHFALIIVSIIFGLNYSIAKSLMPNFINPLQLVFVRVFATVLIVWILHFFWVKEKIKRKDIWRFALSGLIGVAINQLAFFEGLGRTTAVDTSIIHASSPILVFLFATILSEEKFKKYRLLGLFIGFIGTIVLIISTAVGDASSSTRLSGNLLILLNISAYSLYLVIVRPLSSRYHSVTVMKWVFFFGLIFIIPFSFQDVISWDYSKLTAHAWGALFYVVIATTFVGFLLTVYSLRFVKSSTAGYYIYLQPLVAAIVAFILGVSLPGTPHLISFILIFSGLFLINRK